MYEKLLQITEGVRLDTDGKNVKASGPKGTIEKEFSIKDLLMKKLKKK